MQCAYMKVLMASHFLVQYEYFFVLVPDSSVIIDREQNRSAETWEENKAVMAVIHPTTATRSVNRDLAEISTGKRLGSVSKLYYNSKLFFIAILPMKTYQYCLFLSLLLPKILTPTNSIRHL